MKILKNDEVLLPGDEYRFALTACEWLPVRSLTGVTVEQIKLSIGEDYIFRRRVAAKDDDAAAADYITLKLDDPILEGDEFSALEDGEDGFRSASRLFCGHTPRSACARFSLSSAMVFRRRAAGRGGFSVEEAGELARLLSGIFYGPAEGVRSMNSVNDMRDLVKQRFESRGHAFRRTRV